MTQVTIPISKQDFTPSLPKLQPRNLNWMGRIVSVFRNSETHGAFHWALVHTIVLIVSTILVVSVVFSPLFIYGFKEYIRQTERAYYDKKIEKLLNIATENGHCEFLRGRLDPLSHLEISLASSTRSRIINDLEIPSDKASNKTDKELLYAAASKYDNFLERYHFTVHSRSQWAFWRFLGW